MTFSGAKASPDDTVMMVASGRTCRCSMKAAIKRIGPSTFVVTISSADCRNDSG
ncbi:Uncharacterised protein [Mycobacteroides abscessus subsp. abscessus]|nr:Uncharacterised protein [Mycobacteroides abscessus subsp. abscessus]